MLPRSSSSDFWEHLDKLHVERESEREEGSWTRRKTRRVAPLEGERGRERCTHYLHSEKGVGSQSSPPFRRDERGEREKSKWLNGASCCVSLENWSKESFCSTLPPPLPPTAASLDIALVLLGP